MKTLHQHNIWHIHKILKYEQWLSLKNKIISHYFPNLPKNIGSNLTMSENLRSAFGCLASHFFLSLLKILGTCFVTYLRAVLKIKGNNVKYMEQSWHIVNNLIHFSYSLPLKMCVGIHVHECIHVYTHTYIGFKAMNINTAAHLLRPLSTVKNPI